MAYNNRLSTYQTRIFEFGDGTISVQYHATIIVGTYVKSGRRIVELDPGNWHTVTTKRKMNQAAHQFGLGYGVRQRKHQWFITTKAGEYTFDEFTGKFIFDADTGLPWGVVEIFLNDKAEGRALS